MTKINRRDYLKGMGIAMGAIVSRPSLDLFAQEKGAAKETFCNGSDEKPIIWLPRATRFPYPEDTSVKLIFYGLMGFCRRVEGNATSCEIGIHREGDSDHHHKFSIIACQLPTQGVTEFHDLEDARVDLTISRPSLSGVAFYQPEDVESRRHLTNYNDFRWIVDFESCYLYGKHFAPGKPKILVKKNDFYEPKITVKHGLFYTIRKTASTFRAQTKNGKYVSDLGNIADIIGANIYLADSGSVRLTIEGQAPVTLRAPAEVYFMNHCSKNSDHTEECLKESHNIENKKRRSDFFLHYDAFDYSRNTRSDTKEYELFLLDSRDQTWDPPFSCSTQRDRFINVTPKEKTLSDESPCAGSGYGAGGLGFPPP